MATVSLVVAIVQFGLSILAFGGGTAFFSHPAFIALVVVTIVLMIVAGISQGNLSSGEYEDRSNRWVFIAFGVIALLTALVPPYTDRIGVWTIDGEKTRWVGIVLYALGGCLRLWPVFVLGSRFSGFVAIQPGHKLETHGIYSRIRNPSYLGMIITMLGWGLAFRSWFGVLLALSLLIPLIPRIRAEERLLHEQFGTEYEAYCAHTWRLVPGLY
jgi:protein-S-isoprenylcysteine O-methyltransferase Ste14